MLAFPSRILGSSWQNWFQPFPPGPSTRVSLDRLALSTLSFRVGDTRAFCCGISCVKTLLGVYGKGPLQSHYPRISRCLPWLLGQISLMLSSLSLTAMLFPLL